MDSNSSPGASLKKAYDALGANTSIVADTLDLLRDANRKNKFGSDYTRASVYAVINGRMENSVVAEAFLQAVDTELARRDRIKARAEALAAKAAA